MRAVISHHLALVATFEDEAKKVIAPASKNAFTLSIGLILVDRFVRCSGGLVNCGCRSLFGGYGSCQGGQWKEKGSFFHLECPYFCDGFP